ncbi:MAG: sigma-70 family RNA polymerase sigma factor [Myxococcales bacterium]
MAAKSLSQSDHSREAFEQLSASLRRQIKVHCYRMLGSVHEAEDLAQETYLRAWRSFEKFDGGSFRAWLYRIATNACLNALERRKHGDRLLPDQLGPAANGPPGAPPADVPWLEPMPDADLDGAAHDTLNPEARYSAREAVQLAFVAGIQQLPARQRAALLLCDVLGWPAAEAAELLDSSTASINSALQRARATLARSYPEGRPRKVPAPDAMQTELLGRYLRVWEGHDLDGFVALLREDAAAVMPPWLEWYAGRTAIRAFFDAAWRTCGGLHLVPSAANAQPAFAVYERSPADGRWAAHSLHVLTLDDAAISTLTLFIEPRLFDLFGLPRELGDSDVRGH